MSPSPRAAGPDSSITSEAGLTGPVVLLTAVGAGLAVASNYYCQALLAPIGHEFGRATGAIVPCAQAGFLLALIALVPLGDRLDRRPLAIALMTLLVGGLAAVGTARNAAWLLTATLATGVFSGAAQILVPLVAAEAAPERRGRTVAAVMTGVLGGIMLSRTVAGVIAQLAGWRSVYLGAAGASLLVSVALWRWLPHSHRPSPLSYRQLLLSTGSLLVREPLLRRRAAYGACAFGAFSVLWSTVGLLLAAPPYDFPPGLVGLVGLAGTAGVAGRPGPGDSSTAAAARRPP